jgi:diguanylate cyclase (GGDEF)-like protein
MKIVLRVIMIIISLVVIAFTFQLNYTSQIKDFVNTAKSKEAIVGEYIEKCRGFIEIMTVYGNDFLEHHSDEQAQLYDMLSYDAADDSYNLDTIHNTKYEAISGNLTGLGPIPDDSVYQNEIMLALEYNKYFDKFYHQLPEITWVYYTSNNDFINLYPWVPSADFKYSTHLKDIDFYTMAIPENDPLRLPVWTPAYVDEAGEGLMVTLSSPVYNQDTFMGAVSLDITTQHLSTIIDSEYESYIVDSSNSVIAASSNVGFDPNDVDFSSVLGMSDEEIEKLNTIEENTVHKVDSHYTYSTSFLGTPWTLYFVAPAWLIIGKAAMYTMPILIVCVLLFITYVENEKHKRTQVLLSNSLEEIQSYHDLLENAAQHDFLTNTCNRRGLAEEFDAQMEAFGENAPPISMMIGDIDKFKQFNDTYGHTAGDKVLVEIARIMKDSIGEKDIVCRWGGEEFVIVLFGKTKKSAVQTAERIRKAIQDNIILWAESQHLHATMTFGVAEHISGSTIQDDVSRADSALYKGKEQGRNRVVSA